MVLDKKAQNYLFWIGLLLVGFGAGWTMASAGCL